MPCAWCSTSRANKRSHTFMRAVMRSAAKLSYQEAQAAIDGKPSDKCPPLMDSVLRPLWAAYRPCWRRRATSRQPLDLDLPERKILLDEQGNVARIVTPERLAANRLIEEFMIQANVAAAEALEATLPSSIASHDAAVRREAEEPARLPDPLEIKLAHAGTLKPEHFNRILQRAKSISHRRSRQRGGAAQPEPGRIQRREHRALRAEPAPLCAFHLADPALRRSHRPPRADPRLAARRRRA